TEIFWSAIEMMICSGPLGAGRDFSTASLADCAAVPCSRAASARFPGHAKSAAASPATSAQRVRAAESSAALPALDFLAMFLTDLPSARIGLAPRRVSSAQVLIYDETVPTKPAQPITRSDSFAHGKRESVAEEENDESDGSLLAESPQPISMCCGANITVFDTGSP